MAPDALEPSRRYSYDRVAWCYDGIAALYSLGAIAATKASQVSLLKPGDRVLYAGVGCGDDALLAARAGARVTAVDVSPRMLRRFEERLGRARLTAELQCGDVLAHRPARPYDAVAANFFLNVFTREALVEVLARLASLLRPGGRLLVADFALPPGGARRRLAEAYYWPVAGAAWLLGLCALHPIHDYAAAGARVGLRVIGRERFRVLPGVPELYEAFVLERSEASR